MRGSLVGPVTNKRSSIESKQQGRRSEIAAHVLLLSYEEVRVEHLLLAVLVSAAFGRVYREAPNTKS